MYWIILIYFSDHFFLFILKGVSPIFYINQPILYFLAQLGGWIGIGSLIYDTLGALGLSENPNIISGVDPIKSKVRHQVFKVLGKDTRKSKGENSKRTIKKK